MSPAMTSPPLPRREHHSLTRGLRVLDGRARSCAELRSRMITRFTEALLAVYEYTEFKGSLPLHHRLWWNYRGASVVRHGVRGRVAAGGG